MEFLLSVMHGLIDPSPSQLAAAVTAARIQAGVASKPGKKAEREEAGKKAATGRFAPGAAPKLVAVGSK